MADELPEVRPERPRIGLIEPDILTIAPTEEALWTDDSGEDYSGWYCVRAVAMVFDRHLQADRNRSRFSRIL